jgi:uncharacterized RDD family membrane protein YckC/ribosomal protein L40E
MTNTENTPNPNDMSIEKELGLTVKICPQCGARNLPASQFCFQCGTKLPEAAPPDKKICPGCHTENAPTSQYCYKCGLKLPDTLAQSGVVLNPAGFGVRLGAWFIDWILLNVINSFVMMAAFYTVFGSTTELMNYLTTSDYMTYEFSNTFLLAYGIACGISLLINITYYTIAIGKWGKTLGKLAFGLRVVRTDGSRVSYLRALGRFAAYLLNSFTLGFSFLVIAWNKQKRGLHDFICDTMVIRN